MLGQQFYHETIRNIVVGFGTIFNNIQLVRKDNSGVIQQTMKVPLAYGPRQKFLVRLNDDADLTKAAAVTLPRIGFEITGLTYDPGRKLNRVQKFKKVKGDRSEQLDTQYMPVPYNINFQLYILAKQSDDALQIVEQIVPYFNPQYTLTIQPFTDFDTIKEDVPIILTGVVLNDEYEGAMESRRTIIYTMDFDMHVMFHGPISSAGIIRTAITDILDIGAGLNDSDVPLERITITPNPSDAGPDSDFGFTTLIQEIDSAL